MKTLISLITLIFLAGTTQVTNAQPQFAALGEQGPRLTAEQRVDRASTRLDNALELNDEQLQATKAILLSHIESIQNIRKNKNDCLSKNEFKAMVSQRDTELRKVFNDEQYKKYETIKQTYKQRRFHRKEHRRLHKN